ncbi:hypothetical protein [Micromonospora sp. NPDC001898]|uniref:transmembrane-type terpene cyclase n=1 Tax=Micromonospora sp. NPDC001898 TaxID=3364221 RepID=UPI0036B81BD3
MTSDTVVATGVICVIFWLIAYVGIIYRGFKEHTYGMPIAALATNLCWEAAYGFFINPFADHIHTLSIVWFLFDLIILWQVYRYGPTEFDAPVRRYIRPVTLLAIAAAYPAMHLAFFEFNDPDGEYTGFGINVMMSILFITMLVRRGSSRGQSLYIAVAKFLGTLFAWIATALTVTTSATQQWPDSPASFVTDSVTHQDYPLTPLVNYLYLLVFIADIIYIVMLRRRLKAEGVRPWRHF